MQLDQNSPVYPILESMEGNMCVMEKEQKSLGLILDAKQQQKIAESPNIFFGLKSPLAAAAKTKRGGGGATKVLLKKTKTAISPFNNASGKKVSVLLSASVERFSVSLIWDFFLIWAPWGPAFGPLLPKPKSCSYNQILINVFFFWHIWFYIF